jgi:hypothetical protein
MFSKEIKDFLQHVQMLELLRMTLTTILDLLPHGARPFVLCDAS